MPKGTRSISTPYSNAIGVCGDNCIDRYVRPVAADFVGGNAVNVAVHLAAQGATVAYVGAAGNDAEGERVREALEAKGVDCTYLAARPGGTAVTWIEVRNGERSILGDRPGVQCPLRLTPKDLEFLAGCRAVHCSAFTSWNIGWQEAQPAIVQEIEFLSQRGCFISMDFSERKQPELALQLGKSLGVAFSSCGSSASTGAVEQTMRYFHECGTREVVMTLGSAGVIYSSGGEVLQVPARPITPVDTLGAGDAFIAGWLFGRVCGESAVACLERGTRIAAEVCLHFGGWPLQTGNFRERITLNAGTADSRN